MSRRAVAITSASLGVVVVALGVAVGIAVARADEALPGVTIEGVAVGGLGADDVRSEVQQLADARLAERIVFLHAGDRFELTAEDLGLGVDVDQVTDALLTAGREGTFFGDQLRALQGVDLSLDLEIQVDQEALTTAIDRIAATVDRDVDPGGAEVDPITLTVRTWPVQDGVTVLRDTVADLVRGAVAVPGDEELELPVEVTSPETDEADVTRVAASLREAVAEDLVLTSSEGAVTLSPREVAALLSTELVGSGADAQLVLVVTEDAVETTLAPLVGSLLREPRDASYDAPRTPETTFDDKDDATWSPRPTDAVELLLGRSGTTLSPELTSDQLTDALRAKDRLVHLTLADVPPAVTTEQARAVMPDTLLSTFTTYHACCATRVHNIQRLADMVDGTVVEPGEQFSINQISGIRECSKGFRPAGMILNGEIVDSCGGGVSQFGTTTVNAVFFAGLEPDAYKPHSFYISRYPMAREATLNFPSPDIDVRFTNDTGFPILIRTAHTSTSITVSFYGRTDVTEVRADLGTPTNYKPAREIERVNRDLPPGARVQVQGGRSGFFVSLTRTVEREDGSIETDDWSNTYIPENFIYEYNPDEPEPQPDPSPEPEPEPSPSPTGDDAPADDG